MISVTRFPMIFNYRDSMVFNLQGYFGGIFCSPTIILRKQNTSNPSSPRKSLNSMKWGMATLCSLEAIS